MSIEAGQIFVAVFGGCVCFLHNIQSRKERAAHNNKECSDVT